VQRSLAGGKVYQKQSENKPARAKTKKRQKVCYTSGTANDDHIVSNKFFNNLKRNISSPTCRDIAEDAILTAYVK